MTLIIIAKAKHYDVNRIDFVIDRYDTLSIKDIERSKRQQDDKANISIYNIKTGDLNMPEKNHWGEFLSISENKMSLLKYLFEEWKMTYNYKDYSFYMCYESCCYLFEYVNSVTRISQIVELSCNHIEYTRLFLHVKHCKSQNIDSVFMYTQDTDVSVLAFYIYPYLNIDMYILKSKGVDKIEIFNVKSICSKLGKK